MTTLTRWIVEQKEKREEKLDAKRSDNEKINKFIRIVASENSGRAPSHILFKLLDKVKRGYPETILPKKEDRFELLWRQKYHTLVHEIVNKKNVGLISFWGEWISYLTADCSYRCATRKIQILYYDILAEIIQEEEAGNTEGGGENKENNSATDKVIRRLSMKYNKKYNKKYKSALFATGDDNVCGKKKQNLKKKKEIEKKKKKKELEKKKKKKELEKKKKKKIKSKIKR